MTSAWTAHRDSLSPVPHSTAMIERLVKESGSYQNPQRQRRLVSDVFNCCRNYSGLKPVLEVYNFNHRERNRVLALSGVIPITYRAKTYHIPIVIYCPPMYPNDAPIPYVRPTETMVIRDNHANVDKSGRILIPYYLSIWNSDDFNLYGLANCMTRIFSQHPPVNARQSKSRPLDHNLNHLTTSNNHASPYGNSGTHQHHSGMTHGTANYNVNHQSPQGYTPSSAYNSNSNNYSSSHQQPQQQSFARPPAPYSFIPSGSGKDGGLPQPSDSIIPGRDSEKRQLITSLTKRLTSSFEEREISANRDVFQKIEDREQLSKTVGHLTEKDTKRRKLRERHETLSRTYEKLDNWITSMGSSLHESEVDLIVQYKDVTTEQIADCSAEDNAIVDVLDQVDEALVKGVINNDRYVMQVRELSRRQFYPRALKKKLEGERNMLMRSRSLSEDPTPLEGVHVR